MSDALRCDGCGKFAGVTDERQQGPRWRVMPLPPGWLRVYVEDRKSASSEAAYTMDAASIAEVCSRACGAQWLTGFTDA